MSDPRGMCCICRYLRCLRKTSKFDDKAETEVETPTSLIYTLSFYAQHLDTVGELAKALDIINEAIAHTPTILELYVTSPCAMFLHHFPADACVSISRI
jgi:hypothetical protein